ncbi:hypothetical protein MMC20_004063 [Loxospora ochrophaea]|nr:hypothetical protein [Loxospora ochrophaea]
MSSLPPILNNPTWLTTLLTSPHPDSFTTRISISLSNPDPPPQSSFPIFTLIEPGPEIDYALVHALISLVREGRRTPGEKEEEEEAGGRSSASVLSAAQFSQLHHLGEARKTYYHVQNSCMEAWRGLADVVAEGERLENLEKELLLRDSLLLGANGDNHAKEKVERQLAWIREARERNVGELARAVRLAERGVRWRTRTCHWLSGLKAGLIRDILPLLVEVGKREFARVKKEAGGGGGADSDFKSPISAFDDDDDDDDDDDETESDNTQSQQQKQQRTLKRKQKQGAELQTQTQMQTQTGGAKRRMTNAAPAPAVAEDAALPGKKKVRAAAPRKKTTRTRMAGKKKG